MRVGRYDNLGSNISKVEQDQQSMVSEKEGLQKYPLNLHLAILNTDKRESGNLEGMGWKDTKW